jgi:hypothetical protein
MPEGHSHGKNLIGTSQIELVVKLLILRVFDLLANDSAAAIANNCNLPARLPLPKIYPEPPIFVASPYISE